MNDFDERGKGLSEKKNLQKLNFFCVFAATKVSHLFPIFRRVEQQKNSLLLEKNEMLAAVEDMTIEKVSLSINILKKGAFWFNFFPLFLKTNVEKQNKILRGDISDKTQRLDDQQTALAEADITNKKLNVEKTDLEKQIDEADKTLRALSKIKASLATQVGFYKNTEYFWAHL